MLTRIPNRRAEARGSNQRIYPVTHPALFGLAGAYLGTTTATGAWGTAQGCVAVPFRAQEGMIVKQLGWFNGSAAGDNHDIGIYTDAFAKVVSSGSTVGSGSTLWQWVDVTDTPLTPGAFYYIVKAIDATTANRTRSINFANANLLDLCGVKTSTADNFPLPDPLVSMGSPSGFSAFPLTAIACRDPFV